MAMTIFEKAEKHVEKAWVKLVKLQAEEAGVRIELTRGLAAMRNYVDVARTHSMFAEEKTILAEYETMIKNWTTKICPPE